MAAKAKRRKRKSIRIVDTTNEQRLKLPFILMLTNKILNVIGFVDIINQSVEWDPKHWKVSPGNLAKAVILATFLKVRAPLYKIKDVYREIDTEILFGEGVSWEHLNDDAIAQALDRISQVKLERLFSTLCFSLYSRYKIAFNRLHSDTTTISFYGAYEQSDNEGYEGLHVVRGYNKDHRPECKQVVVGKIVNEHGIAVASSTMDGNTSDSEWNQKAIELVKEQFGDKLDSMTYIADSKLINMPLIKELMDPKRRVKFISRCPSNFSNKIEAKIIKQAYQDNKWENIGSIGTGKKACTYQIQEYIKQIESCKLRFIAARSSAGQERYLHKLKMQQEEIEKDIAAVVKKTFACLEDAKKEWERFEKVHKKSIFNVEVQFTETKTEKRPRGNPGRNPKPPQIKTTWQVYEKVTGVDAVRAERLRQQEECFVLITSVNEVEESGAQILRQYKDQSIVEIQFRLLKEPALASAVFLKTPERINALMMLLNVSLLIRALIQYKVRKSISETQDGAPKIGWDNNKVEKPTINFIIEAFEKCYFEKVAENKYSYGFYGEIDKFRITTILSLMELSAEDLLDL